MSPPCLADSVRGVEGLEGSAGVPPPQQEQEIQQIDGKPQCSQPDAVIYWTDSVAVEDTNFSL